MKTLKYMKRAALIAAFSLSGSAFAAGIPTIDAAALAQMAEQITHMKTQIENQISQITELKNQVKAVTGTRNMGNLLKDQVKDVIPSEWADIYKAANVDVSSITDLKTFDPQAGLKNLASIQEFSERAFKDTKARLGNIEGLMAQIDMTQDMKGAADLQNRIATENAAIVNTQVKMDMMARLYENQKEINYRQRVQHSNCRMQAWANRSDGSCE
ncbi:type IV secretion system protein VirB5 [Advenella incenata]|uniref:Type IV secretion system protein VirB5 n=1 Tax=Advenella incenata TaxID=267800 RepID=A0A4Q7V6Y3_9BURK|nr:type IV secretion system protein [Advenella incenata]RZT91053.1 type IV secretion system protein VirB5 [Advenella incenata]